MGGKAGGGLDEAGLVWLAKELICLAKELIWLKATYIGLRDDTSLQVREAVQTREFAPDSSFQHSSVSYCASTKIANYVPQGQT